MKDYDKEPIIVKNMNLFFVFLKALPVFLVCLILGLLYPKTNLLICLPIMFIPLFSPFFQYKRYTKITENEILFLQKSSPNNYTEITKISLNEDYKIFKAFDTIEHSMQIWSSLQKKILFPTLFLTWTFIDYPYLLLIKILFYFFKNKSLVIFDNIIFIQDDKIINLSFYYNKKELEIYFKNKNIKLDNLPVYYNCLGYNYMKQKF